MFNRKYIFKWWIFHCHVSFLGCIYTMGTHVSFICRGYKWLQPIFWGVKPSLFMGTWGPKVYIRAFHTKHHANEYYVCYMEYLRYMSPHMLLSLDPCFHWCMYTNHSASGWWFNESSLRVTIVIGKQKKAPKRRTQINQSNNPTSKICRRDSRLKTSQMSMPAFQKVQIDLIFTCKMQYFKLKWKDKLIVEGYPLVA